MPKTVPEKKTRATKAVTKAQILAEDSQPEVFEQPIALAPIPAPNPIRARGKPAPKTISKKAPQQEVEDESDLEEEPIPAPAPKKQVKTVPVAEKPVAQKTNVVAPTQSTQRITSKDAPNPPAPISKPALKRLAPPPPLEKATRPSKAIPANEMDKENDPVTRGDNMPWMSNRQPAPNAARNAATQRKPLSSIATNESAPNNVYGAKAGTKQGKQKPQTNDDLAFDYGASPTIPMQTDDVVDMEDVQMSEEQEPTPPPTPPPARRGRPPAKEVRLS
eukprot:Opistho-2@57917